MGQPGAKPLKRNGSEAISTCETTKLTRLLARNGSGKCLPFRLVVAMRVMGCALPDYTVPPPRAGLGQTPQLALVYPLDTIEPR